MNEKKKEQMRMTKKKVIRKSRQKISFERILYNIEHVLYLQDFSNSRVKREVPESRHNVCKCFSSFLQETHCIFYERVGTRSPFVNKDLPTSLDVIYC